MPENIKSIEEIYSEIHFNPLEPNDSKFYKDLYSNFLNEMRTKLVLKKNLGKKYFIAGHKGAGKSSFVNYLAEDKDINENFLVAKYSIKDIGNPHDFTKFDFLLSLVIKSAEAAFEKGIELNEDLMREIEKMVKIITEEIKIELDEETKNNVTVGGELKIEAPKIPFVTDWLKAKVYTALQKSENTRKTLRESYKIKPQELVKKVNDYLTTLRSSCNKQILFLVDDMDKIPLENAFELLDKDRDFLYDPEANILFIIDLSVACSSRYAGITSIGDHDFFPSIKMFQNPNKTSLDEAESARIDSNKERIKNLIYKWCPKDYIKEDAIEKIIELSGGNSRQTVRLLGLALENVVLNPPSEQITFVDVEFAENRLYNEYSLNAKHVAILKKVKENPEWFPEENEDINKPDSPFLELIYNLGMMEYRNGEKKWRYPNPVLKTLLNR